MTTRSTLSFWASFMLVTSVASRKLHDIFIPQECIWPDPYGVTSVHVLPETTEPGWVDDSTVVMEKWQLGMDMRALTYCID